MLEMKKILSSTSHRPWPLPKASHTMIQNWNDLLFMHWEISPEIIGPLIPKKLEIDCFQGKTYIGVVPFWMSGIRPRFFPALPWISKFAELNVRVYVKYNDKPGVFFFSLDAANPIAVEVARAWFHLPYYNAKMNIKYSKEKIIYHSERKDNRGNPAKLVMEYEPLPEIFLSSPGTLENWLTERYCLYTSDKKENLYVGEIHHISWPLQKVKIQIIENSMAKCHEIELPNMPPMVLFSRTIKVAIYGLIKL